MNCARTVVLFLVGILSIAMHGKAQFLDLKFTHLTSDHGLPQSTIHGISKDKYGFMWFGTWSGLCRFDGYSFRTYNYDVLNPKSIPNNRIHNILKDDNGYLWILTFDTDYIARYNYEADNFDRVPITALPSSFIDKISRRNHVERVRYTYQDQQWHLDTHKNTIVETHLPTGKTKTYSTNPVNPWAINDTYISDMYLDDQDILWLGSYSTGINKAYLSANPFRYYYHDPKNKGSISENTVNSMTEDHTQNLWIGTRSKGINLIHPDGSSSAIVHDPSNPHSIQSDFVRKVFCDAQGDIWIGTKKGLDRYRAKTKRIERMHHPDLLNVAVYGMVEDREENVWFATWNGIFKYDRKQQQLHHVDTNLLPTRYVWSIAIDQSGHIWAGTEGEGISILEHRNDTLKSIAHLLHKKENNNTISDNRIYTILPDRRGDMWICTGNGLDHYAMETGEVLHFSGQYQGLPKGTISSAIEDVNGIIWVGHKKGISRIDPGTGRIRSFSKQDGLQSNEFAEGAVYKSKTSDKIYFAGNKGVNYFHPDSIRTDSSQANVVLTELQILHQPVEVNQKINGRVLLEKPLYLTDEITLRHDDKSIAISFSALHYTNPLGNRYAYMLDGFDQKWINIDASQRIATYSNLKPGSYTFKVKGSNSDGIWNETPTELRIYVAPAWWASSVAYSLYAVFLLGILILSYYYVVRYTRLKSDLKYEAILHQKERQLYESKVEFFTNISHEIKTPLSLILAPIQQLKHLVKNHPLIGQQLETIKRNGDSLANIVNQLLDIRRIESGHESLQLKQGDIITFSREHFLNFKDLAKEKEIQLIFEADDESFETAFDLDKIKIILNNLLSNAIKFTPKNGKVQLRISRTATDMIWHVDDSGRGVSPSDHQKIFQPFHQSSVDNPAGTGLGLAYTRSLVALHHGAIHAAPSDLEGYKTTFTVRLPLITKWSNTPNSHIAYPTETWKLPSSPKEWNTYSSPYDTDHEIFTLLIVEDNEEMRSYLVNYFSPDYHVLQAPHGVAGMELAVAHLPDLIISDVMMPEMDGITFSQELKKDFRTNHIPIILLTAQDMEEYQHTGLQVGVDDYIIKPFSISTLSLKVNNQIQSRLKLREKYKGQLSVRPSAVDPESPDEALIKKILQYIEDHIAEPDLKTERICADIGLSRTQLYRKVKAITGYSVADLVRDLRLKRAEQLLRKNTFNINEISYMVGFSDPDYFRKSFKGKFGQSPSQYARQYTGK